MAPRPRNSSHADLVRRPVLRVVRVLVAGEVAGRGRARAEGVHVAEQVVAVLHAHARHRVVGRPRQIGAGDLLRASRGRRPARCEVRSHEVDQVKPFAELHPGRVARGADQVAAVVHVDVQVAPVPSLGRRVDKPWRFALDDDPFRPPREPPRPRFGRTPGLGRRRRAETRPARRGSRRGRGRTAGDGRPTSPARPPGTRPRR